MSAFAKQFLLEDARRLKAANGRQVCLGAFGKHPGWADHIDLPLDTDSLALAKQTLYVEGIGGQIDQGGWDKLDAAGSVPFDHIFVWQGAAGFIVGRFWASTDTSGRARYPMVVCFHCFGLRLEWILRHVLPKLERIRQKCVETRSADEVKTALAQEQEAMRQAVAQLPAEIPPGECLAVNREKFLDHLDLGPEREGLWRIIHKVRGDMAVYLGREGGGRAKWIDAQSQQMRLPTGAGTAEEALVLWGQFFNLQIDPVVPRLFVAPLDKPWLDLTVGQPAARDFFCLRASLETIPLTSSVPYVLDELVKAKGAEIVSAFRQGGQGYVSATAFLKAKERPTEASIPAAAAPSPPTPKPASSAKRFILWAVAVVVLALVVIVLKLNSRKPAANQPKAATGDAGKQAPTNTPTDEQVKASAEKARLEGEYKAKMEEAGRLETAGKIAEAMAAYQAALQIKAGDTQAMARLASAQAQILVAGQKAEQDLTRGFQTQMEEAGRLETQKKWAEAQVAYDEALKLKPGDLPALQKRNAVQARISAADRQAEQDRKFLARMEEAGRLETQGNWTAAHAAYGEALKLKPDDTKASEKLTMAGSKLTELAKAAQLEKDCLAKLNAGQRAERAGNWAEAQAAYDEALKLKPNDTKAAERLAAVQAKLAEMAKAGQLEKDYQDKMSEAGRLEASGRFSEAAAAYQAALKFKPDDAETVRKIEALAPKIDQQRQEAETRKLAQFNARLDCFKLWFNVGKPSAPRMLVPPGYPRAGEKAERLGILGQARNDFVKLASQLKSDFRSLQQPPEDSVQFIDADLIPRIRSWD